MIWRAMMPTSIAHAHVEIDLPADPTPDDIRRALVGWPLTAVVVTPELIAITVVGKHYLEFKPRV